MHRGVGALPGDRWVRVLSGACPVDDFFDSLLGPLGLRKLTDFSLVAVLVLIVAWGVFVLLGCLRIRRSDGETQCRQCGYSATGNVSGVCSDCDERIEDVGPRKQVDVATGMRQVFRKTTGFVRGERVY